MDEIKNETEQQIKFPIAAPFAIIWAVLQLVISFSGGTVHLMQIAGAVISVLLVIALFVRKSRGFLLTTLTLSCLIPIHNLCVVLFFWNRDGFHDFFMFLTYLGHLSIFVICLLFGILAFQKTTKLTRFCKIIWFIPGVFSICDLFGWMLFSGGLMYLVIAAEIPVFFLLGWWLTRPYKKPKQQYYATVQNTYYFNGRYQSGNTMPYGTAPAGAMQKVFCNGCGKELLPDEQFCNVCGRKRPESALQTGYQQPIYMQTGYPQDVPSTGMNVLSFFFPVVGLILYLVWKDQTPIKARKIGKSALIGFFVWMGLSILLTILAYVIPMLILFG